MNLSILPPIVWAAAAVVPFIELDTRVCPVATLRPPFADILPDDVIVPVFDIPFVFIELPTLTVPFNAVVDFPDIPIVIGVVPSTFDPMLIAPVVLVVVVEFEPIFKVPVV